jgi:hypothetical protein
MKEIKKGTKNKERKQGKTEGKRGKCGASERVRVRVRVRVREERKEGGRGGGVIQPSLSLKTRAQQRIAIHKS